MGVAVEQARQEGLAVELDPLVAVEVGANLEDATFLHHDVGMGGIGPGAIHDGGPGI